ncbi:MAG: efflux RND transporter periplasmic adaptor subunit [Coriobacteriia bacterium]|nr:efflux RND transporter periplasmic adaptor subunit [Coriobacteriia bacterium]
MRKRIAIVAIVAVLAGAGYLAWRYLTPTDGTQPAAAFSGTVEATEVVIAPLTSGRIVSATATEGAAVKAGDVLFRIDPSVPTLQVKQARAGVTAAKAARDQAKRDGKSRADIAAAQAQLDQAKAQAELAALQLSYCTVTSPVDGTVLQSAQDAGENASPGKTMAVLGRLDALTVSVFVPETAISGMRLGQSVSVTTGSGAPLRGTVSFIASEAEFTPSQVETKDQRTKLVYRVRVAIADSAGALKPGMSVDVAFE